MAAVAHPRPAGRKPELVITQTHADVTRDVVATLEPASTGLPACCWRARSALFLVGLLTFLILVKDGLGHAGYTPADLLERLHHDLRVLDRHRARRHADLGDPVPVPQPVAHGGLPVHRGDDGVRRHDGGAVPDHPHRAAVDLLLAAAVPEPALALAQLQVAAPVGRLRDLDLLHGVGHLPRGRADPRRRGRPRQGHRLAADRSTRWPRSAGRAPTTSGGTTPGRTSISPRWRRRWCSRCTRW